MLNRRLIRIKAFQALYAYLQDESPSLNKSKSYLKNSVSGIENNFITVLLFPIELTHYFRTHMNPAENKYLQTDEGSREYANLSFSGIYDKLVQHKEIAGFMAKPSHRWQDNPGVLRAVIKEMRKSEEMQPYLEMENPSVEEQEKGFLKLYKYIIEVNDDFSQEMEEINMLWEDERIPVRNAVHQFVKCVFADKSTKGNRNNTEESDWIFAEELLEKTVRHYDDFEDMVDKSAPKWDKDRIAKTDMVLMTMALTELLHFPYIPIKVSLNEYLELAKDYSTPQSSKFINGVLDKLVKQLQAEGNLVKKGRGMVG
ncbi:MAG: N utilization substance protein B [Bacteroidia bacterium]|jgi:N utilization substance protein B